ncbi:transposase [Streptomyces californicus]|uniref:transposase n=1 Tax=Streptomyces californicus TaxID=67351 RepID=UPI00381DB0B0
MVPGVPERRSHDCVRAGTTTLLAASEAATGKVIVSPHRRHRSVEFKKFLARLDREVPADLQVHLILDNYATRRTPGIKRWLLGHPRFHRHFTPTSASWQNLVERWPAWTRTADEVLERAAAYPRRTPDSHHRRPDSSRNGQPRFRGCSS